MFYIYCIKLRRSREEFWRSSFAHVIKMIDIYTDELQVQNSSINNEHYESRYFKEDIKTVSSLHDIRGLT